MINDERDLPIDAAAAADFETKGLRFETLASSEAAFEPWFQAMARGFYDSVAPDETIADRREAFSDKRMAGVWDDSLVDAQTPVATASAWVMPLTIPGHRSIPAWAISTITVAPTHRRRGIARNLLEAELRTAVAAKMPVAILTASEATIYSRFGFEPAAMRADWAIDTTRARWIDGPRNGRVQLVPKETVRDGVGRGILERALLDAPGQVGFDGLHWRRLFGMPPATDVAARRVARYDDADGTPQGFVIYTAASNDHTTSVRVLYLCTATDDAYAALWRYLCELDLVTEITAELRPTEEPFRWMIADARAAREDRVGDHLWLRILDVKTTLEARKYSAPGAFVLEVSDALGFADGTWELTIDALGKGVVRSRGANDDSAATGSGAHHLAMTANELAAIYLGATSATTLVRAGRITENTAGAADALDAAFRSAVTPWLSIWF